MWCVPLVHALKRKSSKSHTGKGPRHVDSIQQLIPDLPKSLSQLMPLDLIFQLQASASFIAFMVLLSSQSHQGYHKSKMCPSTHWKLLPVNFSVFLGVPSSWVSSLLLSTASSQNVLLQFKKNQWSKEQQCYVFFLSRKIVHYLQWRHKGNIYLDEFWLWAPLLHGVSTGRVISILPNLCYFTRI